MSFHDQNTGYLPMRDQNDSQYPPVPGEEEDRARSYHHHHHHHHREASSSNSSNMASVTLPSIAPYEQAYVQQPHNYPQQEQRPYPETYQQSPPPGYQQDYGRGGGNQQMPFNKSAPRQRTAIACRYCRRRKIRCSGFDQNPDGRCANCQRFQQECIFTPVSSQAQAFVPAHTVYPSMRNMGIGADGRPHPMYPQGAPLFGAHGQPLPAPQAQQSTHYDYPAPSPTGSFNSFTGDERSAQPAPDATRKRTQAESHPSILPPISGQISYPRADSVSHRGHNLDDDLRLPPVTPTATISSIITTHSPASSHSSHSNLQHPPHPPPQSSLSYISHSTPPARHHSPADSRSDPMSLGNIMERRPDIEIDRSMLGRLGRKGQ